MPRDEVLQPLLMKQPLGYPWRLRSPVGSLTWLGIYISDSWVKYDLILQRMFDEEEASITGATLPFNLGNGGGGGEGCGRIRDRKAKSLINRNSRVQVVAL